MDDFPPGTVWLIGAGPGDPELLTVKARRLLSAADIVFHDALIGRALLAVASSAAVLIGVGKRAGRHSLDQGEIDRLIVEAALAGRRVVRLKGGDPSVFGRSAEEIAACAAQGVPVRVCPGVTTASAAAASGVVSLTLRGLARRLVLVTAHARAGESIAHDWAALAAADGTLAVYMGRAAAPEIARGLIAAGRAPDTPVLIAVNVSLPDERLIRGRLAALPFLVRMIADDDPTLLLIGEAVGPSPARAGAAAAMVSPA